MTLASILARNLDGVLVSVAMDLRPVTVDILSIDGGPETMLPLRAPCRARVELSPDDLEAMIEAAGAESSALAESIRPGAA